MTLPDNHQFPIGATVEPDELSKDPYPVLAALRESEPVSYVPALNMYLVTRYDDAQAVLQDNDNYVVGTEGSLILDIFGEHMMTVEGDKHLRFKGAHRPFFLPPSIRENLEPDIAVHVDSLIDGFADEGAIELRSAFTSRLPVLTMLTLFGMELAEEQHLRRLYDTFEKALANFTWDERIRAQGKACANEFYEVVQKYLDRIASGEAFDERSLLGTLATAPAADRLTDKEIRHNAIIIFFGGISTVDALILNTLYALTNHPSALEEVRADLSLIPKAINETIRWLGPVQSATRHVQHSAQLRGVTLQPGDTVNCMLAAANRDPAVIENPDRFDIHRKNAQRHIGFAVGPHHCLGSHLARAEARVALTRLFERLPGFRLDLDRTEGPLGYEFRQPVRTLAKWSVG